MQLSVNIVTNSAKCINNVIIQGHKDFETTKDFKKANDIPQDLSMPDLCGLQKSFMRGMHQQATRVLAKTMKEAGKKEKEVIDAVKNETEKLSDTMIAKVVLFILIIIYIGLS